MTVLKALNNGGYPFVELIYNIGPNETDSVQVVRVLGKMIVAALV